MKRIVLATLVVVLATSGAIAGGVRLSAPKYQVLTGAPSSQRSLASPSSLSLSEPVAPVQPSQPSLGNDSSQVARSASAPSQPTPPSLSNVPPAPTVSTPAAVVTPECPDGSASPACQYHVPGAFYRTCPDDGTCRPSAMTPRPGFPTCPTGTSTQSVCSPMTN